jgi:hypothetical protein
MNHVLCANIFSKLLSIVNLLVLFNSRAQLNNSVMKLQDPLILNVPS